MMVYLKSFFLVFLLGILSLPEIVLGQMSTETVEQIDSGITTFTGVVDALETVSSNQKMIGSIQQLSGFLGVAGGVLSFALMFLPQQDSAELMFMKKKFAEVNMKLDRISSELDNVKDLITLETQRAAYIDAASKILFGYKRLTTNYLDDLANTKISCSTSAECLRQRLAISESYVQDFNVKASVYQILTGTAESTSVFGDPLLDLIKTTYKCDINKVLNFANGVIKLAFKGQQAVLAYEKLTGTNTSISAAMKDWSTAIYNLRKKVDEITLDCYNNIKTYMKPDVEDTIYQTNMGSNEQAANALKNSLDVKYPWLYWTVLSYGAYGGSKHWGFSSFLNMPGKDARKRVLRVIAQDKGTYAKQRQELSSALEKISEDTIFSMKDVSDANDIYDKFKEELQKTTVWSSLSAFVVLRDVSDLQVGIDNEHSLYYYNDKLSLRYNSLHGVTAKKEVRFWASLKSQEQIDQVSCSKTCSKKGSCKVKPYSSESYCICKPFFNGMNCEHYDKISLAASVDGMLAVTAQIPKLTDIYFEIIDMQNQLGASLNNIQQAITSLDNKLKSKFDELTKKLTTTFAWSNLLTQYSSMFTELTYYLHKFQSLDHTKSDISLDKDAVALATDVLRHEHAEKWSFELNYFIVGRTDLDVLFHKPFLFLVMDKHQTKACSKTYKDALDNSWRQIMVLQNQLYVMWAQASAIVNEPSDEIMASYKQKVANQEAFMKSSTCDLTVANSANIDCSGGFYTYPQLSLINTCKENYFLVGKSSLTCTSGSSQCHACNCNKAGSSGTECSDQTGQCPCTNNYYGKTCRDRNCEWTAYGSYGRCSKSCDYGGIKIKKRSYAVTQKGNGKKCNGLPISTTSCFNGCCSKKKKTWFFTRTYTDFHCSNKKKCIPPGDKCNYDNDCGDSQDENGCSESCVDKYTPWNKAGGGDAVYLDRHTLNCDSSNKLIKMFKLERKGSKIRYRYKCCTLLSSVCSLRTVKNGYTKDGDGNIVYLDRQTVSCGSRGLLQKFRLTRNSDHNKWRFEYSCCEMKTSYKSRLSCYTTSTSYTNDGGGKNYYLDRQTVSCNSRYFLQYFKLSRNSSHNKVRYTIRCCKIKIQ